MIRTFGLLVLVCCISLSTSKSAQKRHDVRKFPEGFLFGTATASYQIEGAWNEDGRTPSIWDTASHAQPCIIRDCDTGDVAGDTYHNYKRDVEMMRELGLDFFRLSLSWNRILPTSFPDKPNELGIKFYNDWLDEMLKYNIEPLVTLFHWDLPQKLQDMGGWTNPYVVDWYVDYARFVFETFGDKVKHWITFNEPREVCKQGYGTGTLAPFLKFPGVGDYMCAKNLLVAHAKTYHMYNEEFKPKYGGEIGITLSVSWFEPETEKDTQAAIDAIDFEWGIYAHPIFSENGDWPAVMKKNVAAKSAEQGFKRSRLPEFTPEEVKLIQGSSDFFGINHYTTILVYKNESVVNMFEVPSTDGDQGVGMYQPSDWKVGQAKWLYDVPWGFYKLLTYIRKTYVGHPPIYITENGYATKEGLDDDDRIDYLKGYFDAMLDAIEEGSDVRLYALWSLLDNFEWAKGYSDRFGIYEVDYESPERTRTPRKSAFFYKELLRTRTLDLHYEPDTTVMTIDEGH